MRKAYGASARTSRDRAALAGAGMLIVFAVAILHAAGAGLRLLVQTILSYAPPVIERRVQGAQSAAGVLPLDVIPLLFVMMAAVFGVLFWREYQRRQPVGGDSARLHGFREPVAGHVLLRDIDQFLGRVGLVGLVVSFALWIAAATLMALAAHGRWAVDELTTLFTALEIAGLLVVVGVMVRGPDRTVERVRRLLGSLADVAGFWAPDLHPLAGASYRLEVLRGLRRGVREVRTNEPAKPIALVGHSQGAVLCAWFIRGGHWEETRSENCSDEEALAMRTHETRGDRSYRIALFTCGSPLGSLYRTFFPRYFNEAFFQAVARKSDASVWHNYWRKTDPFSARLSRGVAVAGGDGAYVRDIDVTELEDEVPKGHYEYWQERRVQRDIKEYFSSFEPFNPAPPTPDRGGVHRRLRGLKVALPRLHVPGN